MYNFTIAQIFGITGIIFSVLSMQMKTKESIMIMFLGLNLSSALNFLFLNSITGSLIGFFAMIEIFINYLYESKNSKIPIYIIIFYVVINLILGLSAYKRFIDLIPVMCALLFCASICTKKEANIRKLMLINQPLWLIYDIIVKAYIFSICNILTIISIIISYFRFDYVKK